MFSVGRSATTYLTLPIVGAGFAATKMALNFDASFTKIQALADAGGLSVEQMKQKVIALAGETAQAPQDLADALYFVSSAGLKASDVFPVLEASAKGAAAGMGSVQDIAQTLTSVMNAYQGTGLKAANVMNIFQAAVEHGKMEADELAASLGPIISTAAQAGVRLEDLAAALATATDAGVPFDRAVTGARFLLQSLQNPTDEARKVLDHYGISQQQIAKTLASPGGLTALLQDLADKFDISSIKGKQAWATVTGGARGAIVANTAVGRTADLANRNQKALSESAKDSANNFDLAYKKMTGTDQFKFQQTLVHLKLAMIDLGETLVPILEENILPAVQKVADWFTKLDDSTKGLIVKGALLAAAFGPVVSILGLFARIVSVPLRLVGWTAELLGLSKAAPIAASGLHGLATAQRSVAASQGLFIANKAGVVTGYQQIGATAIRTTTGISRSAAAMRLAGAAASGVLAVGLPIATIAMIDAAANAARLAAAIRKVDAAIKSGDFSAFSEQFGTAGELFARTQKKSEMGFSGTLEQFKAVGEMLGLTKTAYTQFAEGAERAWQTQVKSIGDVNAALSEMFDLGVRNPLLNIQGTQWQATTETGKFIQYLDLLRGVSNQDKIAVGGLVAQYEKMHGSLRGLNMEALKTYLRSGDIAGAMRFLQGKVQGVTKAWHNHVQAILKDKQSQKQWGSALEESTKLSRKQTDAIGRGIHELEASGRSLTGQQKETLRAAIAAGDYQKAIQVLTSALGHVPKSVHTKVSVDGVQQGISAVRQLQTALEGIQGGYNAVVNVGFNKGAPPGKQDARGAIRGLASGAIAHAGQGMVARTPTLIAEGSYPTAWGRGAEANVPLDSRGIGILAKAFEMALQKVRIVGDQGRPVYVMAPPYREWRSDVVRAFSEEVHVRSPR